MGIKTRSDASMWIARQVNGHSSDPQWRYADPVDNVGATLSTICHRIGMFRYPLYVRAPKARELFGLQNIACLRRMGLNRWESAPRPLEH